MAYSPGIFLLHIARHCASAHDSWYSLISHLKLSSVIWTWSWTSLINLSFQESLLCLEHGAGMKQLLDRKWIQLAIGHWQCSFGFYGFWNMCCRDKIRDTTCFIVAVEVRHDKGTRVPCGVSSCAGPGASGKHRASCWNGCCRTAGATSGIKIQTTTPTIRGWLFRSVHWRACQKFVCRIIAFPFASCPCHRYQTRHFKRRTTYNYDL